MSIETNLAGRLRNTSLPYGNGLLPLFEAIVNSIHAIEEARLPSGQGTIRIEIDRAPVNLEIQMENGKKKPGRDPLGNIIGFRITDDGIGFNDENMKAFKTLDTDHKVNKGGRGIGRLLWLKAFDKVYVRSQFLDGSGNVMRRSFFFERSVGVREELLETCEENSTAQTTISLDGFQEKYRALAYKSASSIANAIFEHCLWYFVRAGGAPKILVVDRDEVVDLHQLYEEHMHSHAVGETLDIKGQSFELLHVKLRTTSSSVHAIAYCADNRLVCEEKLTGSLPGLHGRLSDEAGEFIYSCYVSSGFLNERARPERTGFDLVEDLGELLADTEITWNEIRDVVAKRASVHLDAYLETKRQQSRDRVHQFVSTKAPRYRPIVARIPEDALFVDPDISDKDLDITLHKHLAEIERQLLADGHDLMKPHLGENADEYRKRLEDYLSTAEDIKKSDLANYVSHRKVILDLLQAAIERQPDGRYSREDILHSLIMPMRYDSRELLFENCNLWLLDERLAFHDYLASDKPLSAMPITGNTETKEPDITALNVYDNPILVSDGASLPLASIVVVEIKRPMRNDAKSGEVDDPIEQALGYLERIRDGKVTTMSGRPIPRSEDIPGYCYVVCDITPSIEKRCKVHDLTPTSDRMGFFTYKASYKAYIEVISFDRLVNAAKQRNRAFFDKLGLPTT